MANLQSLEELLLDFLLHRKEQNTSIITSMDAVSPTDIRDIEKEQDYMSLVFCKTNSIFHKLVIDVLNSNEYVGSPIFDGFLTRDYLAQLVDQVVRRGTNTLNDIEEIYLEDKEAFSRHELMRGLIEAVIIAEIFGFRRHRYKNL